MEIDEKVTANEGSMTWGNRSPYASRGTANAALGLGIAGTALGLMSGGLGLFNTNGNNRHWGNNGWNNDFGYGYGGGWNRGFGPGFGFNSGNWNWNDGWNRTNYDYPTGFEVYKKCEDYRFDGQEKLYDHALIQSGQRFNDAMTVGTKMFDLYKLSTEGDFKLYKEQRDGYDRLLNKIHEVDSKVSFLNATLPLEFALERNSRTYADNLERNSRIYADNLENTSRIYSDSLEHTSRNYSENLEHNSRAFADHAIVNYANGMFRTQDITDVTLDTTSKSKTPYDPIRGEGVIW